jgi:hypothetical protein
MHHVDVFRPAGAAADEHEAGAVEHHHAGARAIGQRLEGGHCYSVTPVARFIRALE